MKIVIKGLAACAMLVASTAVVHARADVGVLTCKLKDVKNDVVYTKEEFACEYKPNKGDPQTYTGVFKEVGANLSLTKDATLVWAVLAPASDPEADTSLDGKYFGGSAAISFGAGGAANVLVGGGKNSFTLQPISATGLVGAGAALDVGEFELSH